MGSAKYSFELFSFLPRGDMGSDPHVENSSLTVKHIITYYIKLLNFY
jgi:hypothetical protein